MGQKPHSASTKGKSSLNTSPSSPQKPTLTQPFVYRSVALPLTASPRRGSATPQACRQTFLPQQVPVAQTQPCWQSSVEVQSGRGAQDSLGPQKPVPSAVSKQKQDAPQVLRLLQVDPSQTGAEHWALTHTPDGHFYKERGVTLVLLLEGS